MDISIGLPRPETKVPASSFKFLMEHKEGVSTNLDTPTFLDYAKKIWMINPNVKKFEVLYEVGSLITDFDKEGSMNITSSR